MTARRAHARFREAVANVLQAFGIDSAASAPVRPARKLSEAFSGPETPPAPDVDGLGRWFVNVSTSEQSRIGSHLTAAEISARLTGPDRAPAVVVYRRGEAIAQAYVVMSLATFAGVLERDAERAEA